MKVIKSGGCVWLVGGVVQRASPRRAGVGVLARAVVLAGLVGGAALGLAPVQAPAVGGSAAPPPKVAGSDKDATRLATTRKPPGMAESWRMLDPRPTDRPARFSASGPADIASLTPSQFRAPDAAAGWREEEFAQVQALDGRTIAAPSLRIRLSGLELPQAEEVCRTLDGRLESCAARAATQLELITRHRKVSCRYRVETAGDAVGACRVGGADLAERLLRAGFVRRPAENAQIAASPAPAGH